MIKTLVGGVDRPVQEEPDRAGGGRRGAHLRRQRQGRRPRAGGRQGRAGHRFGVRARSPGWSSASASSTPPAPGCWTSQPERIAVFGAGASGAEIASAYGRLGTEVLLFEVLDRVLPTEDADISKLAERGLAKQNIEILTGTGVDDVEGGQGQRQAQVGRPRGRGRLRLHRRGARRRRRGPGPRGGGRRDRRRAGLVKVDGAMRTSRENVYAIGDLVTGPALAHKASDEGVIAVEDAAGRQTHPLVLPRHPACHLLHPQRGLVRAHRAAGPRRRATTSPWASSSTARWARARSTATAPAWSR